VNIPEALPWAIALMGPTATGKTDLAVAIASRYPCDLISVDSAMIYRGMDIGTAKPAPGILKSFPHRLVDILDPAESYSAERFRTDALTEMHNIVSHGRVPVLVGGTMLYFRALMRGLSELPPADPDVRARIAMEAAKQGWPALHERLRSVDPRSAARIHPNDPQRLQRALEVYALTGRPLSELQISRQKADFPFRVLKIACVAVDRNRLYGRIAHRVGAMLARGLVAEVARLRDRGDLSLAAPSMRSVGYRQVWRHLEGACGFIEMAESAVTATRQLAKRQLTWLRSEAGLVLIGSDDSGTQAAINRIENVIFKSGRDAADE
jgi:tRNA dimethylallyltransferase